ncbi:hypothetical protein Adt_17755 [Abeliophyllum distichum]|uniref:Uncharacterized protein n=1 Tax=Abeliophyllum distichum TaxID=126358 RepID=A0ABD1THG4_9LAMI
MSSEHDDSHNQSDPGTNPEVMDKALSLLSSSPSIEEQKDVDQGPTVACPSPVSTSEMGKKIGAMPKAKAEKERRGIEIPKMRGLLYKRDVPTAQRLDEELKCSVNAASMGSGLRAPGPEERADDLPECPMSENSEQLVPDGGGLHVVEGGRHR